MKKLLAGLVLSSMLAMSLVACGTDTSTTTKTNESEKMDSAAKEKETTTSEATSSEASDAKVKVGYAVLLKGKVKEGKLKTKSHVAAVMVDAAGKLLQVKLDTTEVELPVDEQGKVSGLGTAEAPAIHQSKRQLGDAYNMKAVSGIGKEWYEQIDAVQEYFKNKTLEEVKATKLEDKKIPDLAASATISLDTYVALVEKAMENAVETQAVASDVLHLGVFTSDEGSQAASNTVRMDTAYAVFTTNADNKITYAVLDESIPDYKVTGADSFEADPKHGEKTKQMMKEEYGMGTASGLSKEWNEQADALVTNALLGKTLDEALGLSLDETGKASSPDILAGTTMKIKSLIEALKLAQ